MFDRNFILHLTLIEDVGPGTIQRIVQLQRSEIKTSDLYLFSPTDWMNTFGFTAAQAQKLTDGLSDKKILEYELDLIERYHVQWVTSQDEAYPSLLREIYLPPAVLYWHGAAFQNAANQSPKRFAIVGARKADPYGYRVVNQLVPDLVAAGYTIVSGGAQGIDTAAHDITLQAGGKTVAILGSGLLRPYPASNKKLFNKIVEGGGIVASSFPLTMDPLPGNFPARNRIVSGLSHGCLVVQAAKKSGALISAHYAMEQGREVFAIPGPFDSVLSAGCNALIQQGAKLVTSSADILEEFGDRVMQADKQVMEHKAQQLSIDSVVQQQSAPYLLSEFPARSNKVAAAKDTFEKSSCYTNYSEVQQQILRVCKNVISLEDIMSITQLNFEQVQSELFNLQLDGVVSQDFTGMWTTTL